jgi:UDP-N-acetylmuramoyl-tripeptide--D-alanyl-D-alanine ligase
MRNMTLIQIAEACHGQLHGASNCAEKEASGVVMDSRLVEKDYVFIATVGERVDGHDFINDVFEKGALAVICEKAPAAPKGPYILVESSFTALKDIAKWYRMQLDITVVGITGSVGKTSTKEFISSVLSRKYLVLKTEGNFNNEIGMPLTILKLRDEHEIAVLEMGISNFGEMHRLSEIARPDICVITNIGQCHLENLGTREGILKAKTEIFDFMNEDGSVCINGDDDMLATLKEVKGRKPVTFGLYTDASLGDKDVYATNVVTKGLFGSSCDIHIKKRAAKSEVTEATETVFHAAVPLPGEHMILNAMAATSVGILLNMNCKEIAEGIEAVKPVGGRSNIIREENWTIIDDCYNANPVSMKAAIDLLSMADTKKLAILGDMGELGMNEKALHKEIGEYAAASQIDILVCVGKLSLNMYHGALEAVGKQSENQKVLYYETRDELIEALPSIVEENDTILVKASHFMGFEEIVKKLLKN